MSMSDLAINGGKPVFEGKGAIDLAPVTVLLSCRRKAKIAHQSTAAP
mgnify:CR=1 FL=1